LEVERDVIHVVSVESADGGQATVAVEGGTPATSIEVAEGTEIIITSTPDEGYAFMEWTLVEGEAVINNIKANPTTFTMPAGDVRIKAEIKSASSVFDEGVIILGLVWATRNVDVPGTFAANSTSPGMFYQWNRSTGWSCTDPVIAYDAAGEVTGATWSATDEEGTDWLTENDPCPEGWRVPNMLELARLMDDRYVSVAWVPATEGTIGGKTFTEDSTGESIFLPASGRRSMEAGELSLVGFEGMYWTSNESNVEDHTGAWFLDFTASKTVIQGDPKRGLGQSIRCIAE
jgi:uncharacterized protein (TIGR02145 family)